MPRSPLLRTSAPFWILWSSGFHRACAHGLVRAGIKYRLEDIHIMWEKLALTLAPYLMNCSWCPCWLCTCMHVFMLMCALSTGNGWQCHQRAAPLSSVSMHDVVAAVCPALYIGYMACTCCSCSLPPLNAGYYCIAIKSNSREEALGTFAGQSCTTIKRPAKQRHVNTYQAFQH